MKVGVICVLAMISARPCLAANNKSAHRLASLIAPLAPGKDEEGPIAQRSKTRGSLIPTKNPLQVLKTIPEYDDPEGFCALLDTALDALELADEQKNEQRIATTPRRLLTLTQH